MGTNIKVEDNIEYVYEKPEQDELYSQFADVFKKFDFPKDEDDEESYESNDRQADQDHNDTKDTKALVHGPGQQDGDQEGNEEYSERISKKKLKVLSRMSVAELKQKVSRPELVEMQDVTARDPLLLLHMKSIKNSVPVPRHWCFKRKYLQGKRGFEKAPFVLPDYIRRTGIMELRQSDAEKDDSKTLKAKMREKIRPKMGKIQISYEKLHAAFFKWQTKPRLTIHGDLYYEGKEFETRLKDKKPGELSAELRTALGMPIGVNAHKCPPPWLIAMQRYGPPPSYPHLRIPGLNCPIPEGCSFGYAQGFWGKPPVDETGRPIYGDVFGVSQETDNSNDDYVDTNLWGELEDDDAMHEDDEQDIDDEADDEEDDEEKGDRRVDEAHVNLDKEGLVTPSGLASVPAGIETPDLIELRKRRIEQDMESKENPHLYKVLPEKKVDKMGKELMASTHIYEIPPK